MNYKDFKIHLKSRLSPVYLFLGKERFLIEEAVKGLKEKTLKPGFEEFDFDLFYGGETSFSEIFQKLTLFPMGSERRLVVIRDADKVKEEKELLKYVSSPLKTTVLVLITEKLKGGFISKIGEKALVVDFSIKSYETTDEMKRWLRDWKIEADVQTLDRLQELVGDSLSNLRNEFEKLRLFMGDRRRITKEMVDRVAGYSRIFTRYELSRTLGERDKKKALSILFQLYNWNERPEFIVGVIARELYDLFLSKAVGGDKEKLGRILNKKGWIIEKIINKSRKWHRAELIALLKELSRLDIQYKQGFSPFSSIESFILERV